MSNYFVCWGSVTLNGQYLRLLPEYVTNIYLMRPSLYEPQIFEQKTSILHWGAWARIPPITICHKTYSYLFDYSRASASLHSYVLFLLFSLLCCILDSWMSASVGSANSSLFWYSISATNRKGIMVANWLKIV